MTKLSIQALENLGSLIQIGEELVEADEDCICPIYATTSFSTWREDHLPYLKANDCDLSPDEEVDDFLRRLQIGKPVTDIARLSPTKNGIWEVKLQQTRLFGWFPTQDIFVLSTGEQISGVKPPDGIGYTPFINHVKTERKDLGLDYVAGHLTTVLTKSKAQTG